METRKILIANSKTQKRYEIMSDATTLGELQDQMTAQGIDFTGMDFTEGISKTHLLGRDSALPTNVMFKGQPTNDLVMLLTNTTKQISSGALSERQVAYQKIKHYGLQEVVKESYGKNYTVVPTDTLLTIISNYENARTEDNNEVPETLEETPQKPEFKLPDVKTAPHPEAVEWYYMGIKAMLKSGLLYIDDVAVIADLSTELYKRLKEEQPKISNEDIDAMLASI